MKTIVVVFDFDKNTGKTMKYSNWEGDSPVHGSLYFPKGTKALRGSVKVTISDVEDDDDDN